MFPQLKSLGPRHKQSSLFGQSVCHLMWGTEKDRGSEKEEEEKYTFPITKAEERECCHIIVRNIIYHIVGMGYTRCSTPDIAKSRVKRFSGCNLSVTLMSRT